jgi:hypothetical protein
MIFLIALLCLRNIAFDTKSGKVDVFAADLPTLMFSHPAMLDDYIKGIVKYNILWFNRHVLF